MIVVFSETGLLTELFAGTGIGDIRPFYGHFQFSVCVRPLISSDTNIFVLGTAKHPSIIHFRQLDFEE